jgi:hypothetical protein
MVSPGLNAARPGRWICVLIFPPDGPPTFEFSMWPTVYEIPFHYEDR